MADVESGAAGRSASSGEEDDQSYSSYSSSSSSSSYISSSSDGEATDDEQRLIRRSSSTSSTTTTTTEEEAEPNSDDIEKQQPQQEHSKTPSSKRTTLLKLLLVLSMLLYVNSLFSDVTTTTSSILSLLPDPSFLFSTSTSYNKYSGIGFNFDPVLSSTTPLDWETFKPLLRRHNRSATRGRKSVKVSLTKHVTRAATQKKHRTFGCLRDTCRGLEIEELLDRGWGMRFKTSLINGTRDYKDINYHLTVLMADTTNLNHMSQVRKDLFDKIQETYQGSTYITAFDGGDAIGGNKGQQLRTKMRFAKKFKCKYNDLGIQPAQYRLYIEGECQDLHEIDQAATGITWLLKPEAGSQGQGITFHDSVYSVQSRRPEFFPCKDLRVLPATKRALVQQYIQWPLLLHDCKFDVRVYLLIGSSDPWIVFYHEGYLRRSLSPYTPNSKDRRVYLTNTHYQSSKAGFKLSDHIWPFSFFQDYLTSHGVTGAHYVNSILNPYIRAVSQYVFKSAVHKIKPRYGSYQIIGLDFMIDNDFHVHFIEANGYPGFTWSINFDTRQMVEQLYDLVQELNEFPGPFKHMRPGDRFGNWQMVHSDIYEQLHGEKYNPCEEFIDNMALTAPLKRANKLFAKISGPHKRASTAEFDNTTKYQDRIPGWRYIGGEKGDVYNVRRTFGDSAAAKCGGYSELALEPVTFRLYNKTECKLLFEHDNRRHWIVKQVEGAGSGDGLVYFASLDDMRQDPGLFPCSADRPKSWIAQENIDNPMVLDVERLRKAERIKLDFDNAESSKERRKSAASMEELELINPNNIIYEAMSASVIQGEPLYVQYDIRAYMLVASVAPLMVFYHDGYMRSSRQAFFYDDYYGFKLGEHAITMDSFQYYLASQQITGPHYVSSVLRPYLFKIMEFVTRSAKGRIKSIYRNTTGTKKHYHQLFAFNFVLTKNFRVHLTGVSGDPEHTDLFPLADMNGVSVEVWEVLKSLNRLRREAVLEIATAPAAFARMRYGDSYESLRLVYSEMEQLRYSDHYAPCLDIGTNGETFQSPSALKKTAGLQNYNDKQRASHRREMNKYIQKRWASCKLRSSKEAKELCIRGEIAYRYMVYVQKERITYDPDFITDKMHELEGLHGPPQLPQWKIEMAKNKNKNKP